MASKGVSSSGNDDDEISAMSQLWDEIEADVREAFGEDAEMTAYEASNHLDIRILPQSVKTDLEAKHEDLEVVPYTAFRMTVRR